MKTTTAIIIAVIIIGGSILLINGRSGGTPAQQENIQNVSVVDGKQIIEIKAKGGYTPRISTAKAGMPTILRFDTNGTFDCSASVRIPSMSISELLPNSGSKDIDLGSPKAGTIQGSCGMGMYPFQINFQS
jgi:plastocyanin domain-containing protein